MSDDPLLARIIPVLAAVPGVAAIVLGGSRARGTAHDASDTDIGLYYRDGAALVRRFQWEVLFSIENAELAVPRGDSTHIAGCAYRALACIAQVLFALNGAYLINEKGALAQAANFPVTVRDLAGRATEVWRQIGAAEHAAALQMLRVLESDLQKICRVS
jgi:hypothetical protein